MMFSNSGSAVASLTFSFVTLSFQEIRWILRCHLWCAASSFFIRVTEIVQESNVERTSASVLQVRASGTVYHSTNGRQDMNFACFKRQLKTFLFRELVNHGAL